MGMWSARRDYWRNVSPTGAVGDLIELWKQPTPYRWQILCVSVALTFTLMVVLIPESQRKAPERPHITYISTFEPGRSDDQIAASNIANQKRQDELQARRDAIEERKKEAYRTLGRATGLDVDAMEEQIERDRRAEEAAAARADRAQARTPGDN
jgi:hypothetical protein